MTNETVWISFDLALLKQPTFVQQALANGADANKKVIHDLTPLHKADHPDQINALLAHGADVNARCKRGRTPLNNSFGEKLKILLAHGADVNAQDNLGNTALHNTIDKDKAKVLLAHGANPLLRNNDGMTVREKILSDNMLEVPDEKQFTALLTSAEQTQRAKQSKKDLLEGLGTAWKPSDCKDEQRSEIQQEERSRRQRKM